MNAALTRRCLCAMLVGLLIGPVRADEKQVRVDLLGDPLPPGAIARLGAARLRHGGQVSFVAILPGGKTLLSASADSTVRVWELASGKELRRFTHREENDPALNRGIAVFSTSRSMPLQASLSADGKVLVTALSNGRTVRVWDVSTGKSLHHFFVQQYVNNLALTSDGKTIAIGTTDNSVRLFDTQGKEVRSLGGNDTRNVVRFGGGFGSGLRFSPDGKLLLALNMELDGGTFKRILRAWDVTAGKEAYRLEGEGASYPYASVPSFSPDGKLMAVGSGQGEITVSKASDGKDVRKIKSALARLDSIVFSPDGKTLIGRGLGDGAIGLWEVETGKAIKMIGKPAQDVNLVRGRVSLSSGPMAAPALSPDGKTLINAEGNIIRLLDLTTGKELPITGGHAGPINLIRHEADGKKLISQGLDGTLRIWEPSGKEIGQVRVPDTAYTFTLSPDTKLLWAQNITGSSELIDTATGKVVRTLEPPAAGLRFAGRFGAAAFSPDGKTIALRSQMDTAVHLFSAATGKQIATLGKPAEMNQPLRIYNRSSVIAFSPDSKLAAAAGTENNIVVWELPSGHVVREIALPPAEPTRGPYGPNLRDLSFSKDGRTLALDLGDNRVLVHEVLTGLERRRYLRKGDEPKKPAVFSGGIIYSPFSVLGTKPLAVAADGRRLALAGEGRLIHVWDSATGEEIGRFQGHDGEVTALAFAPDGKSLASAGEDAIGLIWDVTTLKPSKPLPGKLEEALLAGYWSDLGGADGGRSFAAICALAAAEQTPGFLEQKLKIAEDVEPGKIEKLIADLDARRFPIRKKAQEELEKIGGRAAPALKKAREAKGSEELRKRIDELLEKAKGQTLSPGQMQVVRAIETLERAGTPAAKAVLEKLAKGAAGALETLEARTALDRFPIRP